MDKHKEEEKRKGKSGLKNVMTNAKNAKNPNKQWV